MVLLAADAPAPAPASAPAPAAAKPASGAGAADTDLQNAGKEAGTSTAADEVGTGKTLQERIRAVSRRVFLKRQRFEIEPQFGFTTNDALERDWSFGARASYHFNEEFAIDFGGAYAPINQALTDVRVTDGNNALKGVQVTKQFGYADAGVTFSPFYGKLALLAEEVVHFDGFLSGGVGATFDNEAGSVHPALEVGVGTRIFLTHWLTMRADLRNYVYPVTAGNSVTFPSSLLLTFGLGFHLPL
ncbi:MAG TPA: outer membrane beta-barrel domain-containing protein, partial [Myxococcota bacterium]